MPWKPLHTFASKWILQLCWVTCEGQCRLPAASGGHLQDCNSLKREKATSMILQSHKDICAILPFKFCASATSTASGSVKLQRFHLVSKGNINHS